MKQIPARRLARWFWLAAAFAGCAPQQRPLRVLYVENAPRWEYRSLSSALIRDESLEVHCFLLSADPELPQAHSQSAGDPRFQAPLKSLPSTLEQLLDYDVVILGDVGPDSLPEGTAEMLRSFVTEHGRGVLIVAGEAAMPGGWKGTDLEQILPVESETVRQELAPEERYVLTTEGKESGLVEFADELPPIQSVLATRAKAGARTLAETGRADRRMPLFVTMSAGRGLVFFSGTDETWRWRFKTGDGPYFYPFWRRVIEKAGRRD